MKVCTKCLINKPFVEFHKRHNRASGYVSKCKVCIKAYSARWFEINRYAVLKQTKQAKREWYHKNRDRAIATNKAYRASHKQVVIQQQKLYRDTHKEVFAYHAACRRSLKALATPPWLTDEQKQEIKQFYGLTKDLSWLSESPLEVDHIVPIKGKNVVGLHVPWNLQILPKSLNQSKGNKL